MAALAVLALHTLPQYFFWAWSAVDLFFILSGFLITSILIANQGDARTLWPFYVRRALRIWPVYYVSLAAAIALYLTFGIARTGEWPALPSGQWLCLIFLQYVDRYLEGGLHLEYLWYFDHSWSLAVEEQFYLLWPLLFFAFRPRWMALLGMGGALLAAAAWARDAGMYFWLLITRIDGLVWGVALAYAAAGRDGWFYRVPPRAFVWVGLLSVALLTPYLLSRGQDNVFGEAPNRALETSAFCMLYACGVALCIRQAGAAWLKPLRLPLLTYFGRTSFAIYMYQVPIAYLLLELSGGPLGRAEKMALWALTLGTAHLSQVFIERRALALKARFPYRNEGTA